MKNIKLVVVIIMILVVILLSSFLYINQRNTKQQNDAQQKITTSIQNEKHIESYIDSMISVFHYLYLTTQELDTVTKQYPDSAQDVQQTTAMLMIDADLKNAQSRLTPYTSDSDQSIFASALMMSLDISAIQKANNVLIEAFRNSTPENYNAQEVKYDIAQYVAATTALRRDLFENNMLRLIKYNIQLPVEDKDAVGQIRYALTSSSRDNLLSNINTLFGSSLENYNDNIYLLAVKFIQQSLIFKTYEEQRDYKFAK